jgi:hypothetical protein
MLSRSIPPSLSICHRAKSLPFAWLKTRILFDFILKLRVKKQVAGHDSARRREPSRSDKPGLCRNLHRSDMQLEKPAQTQRFSAMAKKFHKKVIFDLRKFEN